MFIFSKLNRRFFIRLGIVILLAYFFFGYICIPVFVKGPSMEPTYGRVGFNFCWRPAYWLSQPKRGDIVVIKFTNKILLLKRIIALAGDTVSFRNGKLYVNDNLVNELYVSKPYDWNLPARKVKPGKIYVVGDNRRMPMVRHKFGQVSIKRLYGVPLW